MKPPRKRCVCHSGKVCAWCSGMVKPRPVWAGAWTSALADHIYREKRRKRD